MPVSRGLDALEKALYTSSTARARSRHRQARLVLLARAERSARPRRRVRARARRFGRTEPGVHRRQGRRSSGSSIARPASTSGTRKRSSRTCGNASTRRPGEPRYRQDILDAEVGEWVDGCPSTEGGHNWQAMSHNRTTNALIIPLSQSCIAIRAQRIEQRGRRRQRRRRRSAVLRDAGHATATSASSPRST